MKLTILAAVTITIWWTLRIACGTFLVDPAMLYISGYWMTYFIYRKVVTFKFTKWQRGAPRRFFLLLFPISIIMVWLLGILPYYEVIESTNIYLGLLPQSFVGPVNGNDFMWNGLGIQMIFGRVVPLELIPTYRYFWFNALAHFIWFGTFIPVLAWGVLNGRALSLLRKPNPFKMAVEVARVFLTGFALSFITILLTLGVVAIYT